MGQAAVAAEELGAVAGHRAEGAQALVDVEEADPVAVVVAVGVPGVERAAVVGDLGDDVRRGLPAQVAEHPFDVPGGRQLARAGPIVGEPQHEELDRRVGGDVDLQLRADAGLAQLEGAVAEAVAGDVGARLAFRRRRQRGRRPELAGLLVAQVDRLAAGVGDRIVVPRRQPQLVRVLAPGVAAAGLRDDAAEARIGDDVGPGRRRPLARRRRDDVFAAVAAEAADAVEQPQALPVGRGAAGARAATAGAASARRVRVGSSGVPRRSRRAAALRLLGQRAAAVAEHDAGDRLQQDAVFVRRSARPGARRCRPGLSITCASTPAAIRPRICSCSRWR